LEIYVSGEKFPVNIWKEGKVFVADCPILGIASQGLTYNEAYANLREAIELYFEDEFSAGIIS